MASVSISVDEIVQAAREEFERHVTTLCKEWKVGDDPTGRLMVGKKFYTGLELIPGPFIGDNNRRASASLDCASFANPLLLVEVVWDEQNLAWVFDTEYARVFAADKIQEGQREKKIREGWRQSWLGRFWKATFGEQIA